MSLFNKNIEANKPYKNDIHNLVDGRDRRATVVGSGPSLDLIKPFPTSGDFTIICDGSIWEFDWIPDAVITCELDSQEERPGRPSTEQLLDHGDLSKYKGVPLICPTWANRLFVERWPGPKYYYHNRDPQYFREENTTGMPEVKPTAPMVGFHAIAVCFELGFSAVDVFGFDCTTFGAQHHSDNFPLDGWEEDLEKHFLKHRATLRDSGGYMGHPNVLNHSPLSALRAPNFQVRMA